MKRFSCAMGALALSVCLAPILQADNIFTWSFASGDYGWNDSDTSDQHTFSTHNDGAVFDLEFERDSSEHAYHLYFDITGVSQTMLARISGIATDGFIDADTWNRCGPPDANSTCHDFVFGDSDHGPSSEGHSGQNGAGDPSGQCWHFNWNQGGDNGSQQACIDSTGTFVLNGQPSGHIDHWTVADDDDNLPNPSSSESIATSQSLATPEPATFSLMSAALALLLGAIHYRPFCISTTSSR